MTPDQLRARFHELHAAEGLFVMPNPWDAGSARILESLGFPALATTSSGFANSIGVEDGQVDLDQLLAHTATLTAAIDIPLNVDSERCFADTPDGVADVVRQIAGAGAAGCSIEDWDPGNGAIDPIDVATERVAAAVVAANETGMVLTARAENHLRGRDDLDDTIARLTAFRDVGAHCLYAPGLADPGVIERVVEAVAAPVNVLALPGGPPTSRLAELGVRRVSTGGSLARAAYGSLVTNATELLDVGTSGYAAAAPSSRIIAGLLSRKG
jgi:2-methylisocitrate lyase-like PEP mutase family enzyme